ncbi:unnamed protein product [marine sediment metagenome]|uniref:Uncharacterized protein n=1 Tax=marine sediment metagenome TaxID=412755 RepID=X1KIS8_9ZZZZ
MIDNLTDWLMKLVQPLVVRVMTALGLSVVTIEGTQTAFQQTLDYVQGAVNSMPAAVLQMGELFGISTGMSWCCMSPQNTSSCRSSCSSSTSRRCCSSLCWIRIRKQWVDRIPSVRT